MAEYCKDCEIAEEDLRAALKEMRGYLDITEKDLKEIYAIALKHARKRIALKVLIRDVMTKEVITVGPGDDIHEAARLLSEHKVSGLPVIDDHNRVVGIITEADILSSTGIESEHRFKDILRHILGEPVPKKERDRNVGSVMHTPVVTIGPDADIRDAAKIIAERRIKRLPVVDDANTLLGIISRADIVKVLGEETIVKQLSRGQG